MSREIKQSYESGAFRIDTVNRQLLRDGTLVPLKAKAVDTLLLLVQHNGEVVEKDDLMTWLWPDSFVEEANLTQNIYMLRKALGEGRYIETVPRRGYRFAAEVKEGEAASADLIVVKEKTRTSLSYEEEFEDELPAVRPESAMASSPATIDVTPSRAAARSPAIESLTRIVNRGWLWPYALIVAVVMIAAFAFWPRNSKTPFENVRLTRFTTTGTAARAAISPDGKYLAYVVDETGIKSIWLKQVATGKDLQIVPA